MVRVLYGKKTCPRCGQLGILYQLLKGKRWYYYVYHGKTRDGRNIMHYAGPVHGYKYHRRREGED